MQFVALPKTEEKDTPLVVILFFKAALESELSNVLFCADIILDTAMLSGCILLIHTESFCRIVPGSILNCFPWVFTLKVIAHGLISLP